MSFIRQEVGVLQDLPPILNEALNQVDHEFMIRLISYCANVYGRYEILPVVLVFVIGEFANVKFEEKFVVNANFSCVLETQCEHWAKSVNFVTAKSIEDHVQDRMDLFVALAYFTTSRAQSLGSLTFASDLTVRFLYSLCKRYMKKKRTEWASSVV